MAQQRGKEEFLASVVKINLYSIVLATLTATIIGLLIGMFSFLFYLHILAGLPYLLDMEKFSFIELYQKIATNTSEK